jgi:galactokinase
MGDHTDYNAGFVLPMLIPQSTQVSLRPRADHQVNASSTAMPAIESYRLGDEARRGSWVDYLQGVTYALRVHGCSVSGFDVNIDSNVPAGAGLSSSAALEVALLRALREAFALDVDDVQLARLGCAAETDFIGVPIGIMDQMVASVGKPNRALFIDTRSLETANVSIPSELEVAVIDSGIAHDHSQNEYRERREDCERAARALGLDSLRDFAPADEPRAAELDERLRRRVRHVLTENARVRQLMDAFEQADLDAIRSILAESHSSLRDDYEVSTPEIDRLVQHASALPDVIGARLTGGGFGGSVVLLARRGAGRSAAERIARDCPSGSGKQPRVLLPLESG